MEFGIRSVLSRQGKCGFGDSRADIGQFDNATANFDIYNASMTYINPWLGSVWQQATTALSYTDPNC